MPFLTDEAGPVYYRHWPAPDPKAAVVFLPGFGENTGHYHRHGFALNAAGIDLWAIDQLGHGLSPGQRGQFGTLEDSSRLAERLTAVVEHHRPGIPVVAQGHSYGAVVTLSRLLDSPGRYPAAVVSGAPLVAIRALVDADTSLELAPAALSADPFYLDLLATDPLGFTGADGTALARELDRAWDRFGAVLPTLTVPTLALHGESDSLAPLGAVRAYAAEIPALQLAQFAGGRHDVLNDTMHREVVAAVVSFLDRLNPTP